MSGEKKQNKTPSPQTSNASGNIPIDASTVRQYLLDHIDFFESNVDILRQLTPAERYPENQVVDLRQFMVDRLRQDVGRLEGSQSDIIEAWRANLRAQAEVHEGVLAILSADSFERMVAVVTSDLADILHIDVVSLCVEATDNDPMGQVGRAAVYVLPQDAVDRIIGAEEDFLLQDGLPPDRVVFGPASGVVKSFALARLRISPKAPVGILALGSRDAGKFQTGHGVELLRFLVHVIEQQFRAWLVLPA